MNLEPKNRKLEDLRLFFYRVVQDNGWNFHPSEIEKIKNNKWLQSVLDSKDGDINGALHALVVRYVTRKKFDIHSLKCNVKLDKKYSKAIRLVGKDNEGSKVLFLDITEIMNLSNDQEIREHISYWIERLERLGSEKITLVLHHGKAKFMERAWNIVAMLGNILVIYPGLAVSTLIFKDFVSSSCKVALKIVCDENFMFVNQSNWSSHFKLDEKYDLSNGYLEFAQKKPNTAKSNDEKSTPLVSEKIKNLETEILDNVDDIEKMQKNKLKQIIARLHDLENQVFQLIRDVQELI